MDTETRNFFRTLDERTRRIEADCSNIRGQLTALKIKVAAISGAVATIIGFLFK